MANSQSLSVFACIGLVNLLFLASEVSAQNHNGTVATPWVWVDLPDAIVTGNLALRPGQQSRSWNEAGWHSFGQKANAEECKQTCGADKNCWAFTWYGSDNEWSGFCYGRGPNTLGVFPAVFTKLNFGYFSAYKSFAGQSFPDSFFYREHRANQRWHPHTSFEQLPGVHFFADGFSSNTTKRHSIDRGTLELGATASSVSTKATSVVKARSGAVNIGVTFTEDMCSDAANYMIYLDLVNGCPSIVANYYTWFMGSDSWTHLCLIGSRQYGEITGHASATSGKRTGVLPLVVVEYTEEDAYEVYDYDY